MNDTVDTSSLNPEIRDYCHLMNFTIWKDSSLTIPFTNSSVAFMANYEGFYNIYNESVNQQLVIMTDLTYPFKIYIKGEVKGN